MNTHRFFSALIVSAVTEVVLLSDSTCFASFAVCFVVSSPDNTSAFIRGQSGTEDIRGFTKT